MPASDDRILLFDLGGVVVESAGLAVLQERLPQMTPAQIQARWLGSAAVGRFERGAISPDDFAKAFLAEWPLPMGPEAFLREFATWVRGFLPGAARLLAHLRQRHTVACLSNTNAVHWGVLSEVREAFDVCVVSHLIGHMKPDRAAYEQALQRLGATPQQVYFFDDLAANVAAARALGLHAFQVRGVAEAEAALRAQGIDVPALLFVYGSLKEGFPNFHVNQGRRVPGRYRTLQPHPFYLADGVLPCLLPTPGAGHPVIGQLFEVDAAGLAAMDALERVGEPGGYTRETIDVVPDPANPGDAPLQAFVYMQSPSRLTHGGAHVGPIAEYTHEHARSLRW